MTEIKINDDLKVELHSDGNFEILERKLIKNKTIAINEELHEKIVEIKNEQKRNINVVIETALEEFIERYERDKAES